MRRQLPHLIAAVLAVVGLGASVALAAGGPPSGPIPTPQSLACAPPKRSGALRQEQSAVLARLGSLTVLRNAGDLRTLAIEGWSAPTDQFASFKGIGVTISNPTGVLQPGSPNQLYYAPQGAGGNPAQPAFPYKLIGWGYSIPYAPFHMPSFLPCLALNDWFLQERGIYDLATGNVTVMPPTERVYGAGFGALSDPPALQPVVGFPHPRKWTVHLWLDPSGAPASSILDPNSPPSGLDPHVGSNFYPLAQPPTSVLAPFATGSPVEVPAGGGEKFTAAGGTYTFKSLAVYYRGNQLSVIDAQLPSGATRPDSGPIAHDEGWYVLDGEIKFTASGQTLDGTKGSFVYLPAGTDYAFTIPSTAHAIYVTASVPNGRATTPHPFALQAGEGEKLTVGTEPYIIKASATDTGGSFSLVEVNIKRGHEPLPHIHHFEIEFFYVLDGEMTFVTGGQTIPVTSGDLVQLPVGLPHFYTVNGNGTFHGLLFALPGGLENLFRVLSQAGGKPPPKSKAAASGVEQILPTGPPPG